MLGRENLNILSLIHFIGGLALFILGMNKMSDNLQAVAGNEMRRILKLLTDKPIKGVLVGMGLTGLIQSSSAVTVMMIGLVNTGIMTLQQAVGVVMGANIGTTVTAQLIAFDFGKYALLFVSVGVSFLLIRKSRAMERWGQIVIGFGLLFIGLSTMSASVEPLQDSLWAQDFLIKVSSNPILGILAGTIFTMLFQSSAASVGIVMVLAANKLIPFEGALYLVYGDNIGTTITAWLAGICSNSSARQVAMVHTLFNLFGTIIIGLLTYLGIYTYFIDWITPGNITAGEGITRHIANAHTFFNVLNTLIFLPFAPLLATLAQKIVPQKKEEDELSLGEPKHLDYHIIANAALAINQVQKEMREMLKLVRLGVEISYAAFRDRNYKKQIRISRIEEAIDYLQKEITLYLVAVNEESNSEDIIRRIPALLHTVNDIEKAGDYTEEINRLLNYQVPDQKLPLSEEFKDIIGEVHTEFIEVLDLCIEYLQELNSADGDKILQMVDRLSIKHLEQRLQITELIQNGACDAGGGLNTISFLDTVETAVNKLKNIAEAGNRGFVYDE